jgi:hypothetical protein
MLETLLNLMNIKKTNITPFHPQKNTQANIPNKKIAA